MPEKNLKRKAARLSTILEVFGLTRLMHGKKVNI